MKEKFKYLYKTFIIPNNYYFIGFILYIISLSFMYFLNNKDILLEFFNNHRTHFFNIFFIAASKIAEEEGIIIVFIILIFFRFSAFILSALSISLATIITNIIKTITDFPRPLEVYSKIHDLTINLVPGVEVHRFMSFPSGHTAATFAMLLFLLKISKNNYHRISILFLSILVAISRVYLFQHFTRDVLVASIIGILIALLIMYLFLHFRWYLELDKKNGIIGILIDNKKDKTI